MKRSMKKKLNRGIAFAATTDMLDVYKRQVKNVPSDCVSVVIIIAFPERFNFFQTSSVPIIRPTAHSRTCMEVWYHEASRRSWFINERA